MIISFIRYSLIFGAVHFLNLPVFIINIDAVLSTVVVTSLLSGWSRCAGFSCFGKVHTEVTRFSRNACTLRLSAVSCVLFSNMWRLETKCYCVWTKNGRLDCWCFVASARTHAHTTHAHTNTTRAHTHLGHLRDVDSHNVGLCFLYRQRHCYFFFFGGGEGGGTDCSLVLISTN